MAFEKVRGVSPDELAKPPKDSKMFGLCQTFELPIMHMCITEKPLPVSDLQQTRDNTGIASNIEQHSSSGALGPPHS